MKDFLALRGKISIDYDWEREEEAELKATEDRERLHVTTVKYVIIPKRGDLM